MHKILVLGLTGAGRESLPDAQVARVLGADLLAGGERQLACFPDYSGERFSLRQGIAEAASRLRQAYDAGRRAVVLASGDPLCYGIGASLRRWFTVEELEIVPAPSAYQLAFAALGEPWHDAALLSAHGRPLAEVVRGVAGAPKAAILTDDQHTPAAIARALLEAGLPAACPCAICENLAEPAQRIVRASLAEAAEQTFAPLNVLVVWRGAEAGGADAGGADAGSADAGGGQTGDKPALPPSSWRPSSRLRPGFASLSSGRLRPEAQPEGPGFDRRFPSLPRGTNREVCPERSRRAEGKQETRDARHEQGSPVSLSPCLPVSRPPGLPDDAFSTTGGLITKRELRLLSLAELALQPGEVLWDIGAGSGAVGIEAARWQPAATVYAVERRAELCAHIRENLRRFPAPNLHLVEGGAPAICAVLPDPDAVFIGGSGGHLAELIALVQGRLRPGGRLVLTLVTLEHLHVARDSLPDARIVQVQLSVGAPIREMLRLEAQNPVFVLTWRR